MQTKTIQNKSTRNFFLFLASVVLIGICYFVYQLYKAYPLGDVNKLEYIGKVDYGCWVCDSMPGSTYFYQTNLPVDQVVAHFKRAKVDDIDELYEEINPDLPVGFSMKSPNGGVFYVDYYTNGEAYAGRYNMHLTRQHVITISNDQYPAAKESL